MVEGMFEAAGKKQHMQFFRNVALRKKLMPRKGGGIAYVPYIGDGDLAVELYSSYKVYGADLDPMRVKTASSRLSGSNIKVYDCDLWPFHGVSDEFTLADFDAYNMPYNSFKAWWNNTTKADQLTLFFTDGVRQAIIRSGTFKKPDGEVLHNLDIKERRKAHNLYFKRYIYPWFVEYIKPYKVIKKSLYLRGSMIYWGAVIKK